MAVYGISSWLCARLPVTEAIAALREAGFTQVELSDEQASLVQAWEKDPAGTADLLKRNGLRLSSVHSPEAGRQIDALDEQRREASVAQDLRYLELMADSGVPEIIIHPTSGRPPAGREDLPAYRAGIVRSLDTLSRRAATLGLRLAVENLLGEAQTMEALLELVEPFGNHVGLCHDVGHTVQARLDPLPETQRALQSGRLFSLHLHDVNADLRDHFIPGEGTVNLPAILRALDDASFLGIRTLEIARAEERVVERVRQAGELRARWEAR